MKKMFTSSVVAAAVLATSALGSGFSASALTVESSEAIFANIQEEFLRPENLDNLFVQGSDWFKYSLETEAWQQAAIDAMMANSDDYPYDIWVDLNTNAFVLESINTPGATVTFWPAQTSDLMTCDTPHYTIDLIDRNGLLVDITRNQSIVNISIEDINTATTSGLTYDLLACGWSPEQLSAGTTPSFTVIDGESSYAFTALDFAIMGQMQELIDIFESSTNPTVDTTTDLETPAMPHLGYDSEAELITIEIGDEAFVVQNMSEAVNLVKNFTA